MKASWFCISNKAADALEIDVFDEIGVWGVSAKDFVTSLRAAVGADVKKITVNINTPGGDCNEGFTIFDALQAVRASGVKVTANITGMAASMGSVIMLASDERTIAEHGRVMVHRVAAGSYGNADELEAMSKVARQFEDRIVGLYMEATGKDEETVRGWMKTPVGTWFLGEEAVEAGFAHNVKKGAKAQAFRKEWASKFEMLPAALFDMGGGEAANEPQSSNPMNKLITALAAALSIKIEADYTEDQIAAAFAAYKPAPIVAELNLEDKETKERFDAAVNLAIQAPIDAMKSEVKALQDELAKFKTAAGNGMLSAAASGTATAAAVVSANGNKNEKTRDEFAALSPREKSEFIKAKGKLID
jgi:ATP-dependent protease ClpP protease subunit